MAFQSKTKYNKAGELSAQITRNYTGKNISPECVIKADCLNMLKDICKD